jgi:ABC-type branched-subunit amino acid transport system substrate-binding protein
MTRTMRRCAGAFLAIALSTTVMATAAGAAGGGSSGETGITPDAFKVALLYGDTSGLEQAGILAKIGDRQEHFQTFVDAANEAGGAGGRQLEVTTHTFPVPSTATDERSACVAGTEDDGAAVVVFAGNQTEETLLCAADEHERIALVVAGNARPSTLKAAKGRLFMNDMSAPRLMKNWVKALKKQGTLKGKTIGIVRGDISAHEEVAKTLTKELKKAGFDVTEEVALPCAGMQACEQNDVGAERFQTKGVDAVFSLLSALANPAFITAADSIGFNPQWLASDFEFQVYDTTAKLMAGAKEPYDGAIGISTSVKTPQPDAPRTECNQQYTDATGITAEPLTDEWSDVGTMCFMVDRIVKAADAAEAAGGLTQASFIDAYSKLTLQEGNRKGAWGPKKRDGYDTYQLFRFDAGCTCWQSIKGTATTDKSS